METSTVESNSISDKMKPNIWKDILGSPRYIVAPMVDASELAWRLLSRRHGSQLCYTPMLHSSVFCRDPKYRREALASCAEDHPLIVQFCGNDPKILLEAALLAEPYCQAVDINLGCPQAIAKRGHYGAFLQDDWELLKNIVRTLSQGLKIPVTCKLRIFPEISKTIEYALMLEEAGAAMLTVHGRTRDQKGPLTGLASWEHIKAVREHVKVPMFANGNIQTVQDADRCIEETNVEGVMSAEGNLYNPLLFEGRYPPAWEPALEYLDLVDRYPAPSSYILFCLLGIKIKVDFGKIERDSHTVDKKKLNLFRQTIPELIIFGNEEERGNLARNSTMESFRGVVEALKARYLPYHEGHLLWETESNDYNLKLPPWLCQPYVRDSPQEHLIKVEAKKMEQENSAIKRDLKDEDGNEISRKRLKKLRRIARRPNRQLAGVKRSSDLCTDCPNPLGYKCGYKLCRQCCRKKCFKENLDCAGHRNLTKTRRQIAIEFAAKRREIDTL